MPRGIVYDGPAVNATYIGLLKEEPAAGGRQRRRPSPRRASQLRKKAQRLVARGEAPVQKETAEPAATEAAAEAPTKDDYLAKIAKYVPAETITAITLVFAAWNPDGNTIYVWLAIGAIVNAIYLFSVAVNQSGKAPLPRAYFYVLAAGAFVLWAIAMLEPVQTETGIVEGDDKETEQTAVLASAAFLIPALDTALDHLRVRVRVTNR
jgi:hypothetical protein